MRQGGAAAPPTAGDAKQDPPIVFPSGELGSCGERRRGSRRRRQSRAQAKTGRGRDHRVEKAH